MQDMPECDLADQPHDPAAPETLEFTSDRGASRSFRVALALTILIVGWMGSGFVLPAKPEAGTVEGGAPQPGVEVSINVNRAEAARFGADVSLLGQAVQPLTQGIIVAGYRPGDVDGTLDIRVRFPYRERSLAELGFLLVPTSSGLVPISNFVSFSPTECVGTVRRIDEKRVVTVEANVAPGVLVNDQVIALGAALEAAGLPDGVSFAFAGEAEDQTEAMVFLVGAFIWATFLMFVILLLQFNSFYQAFVVMSAIVFPVAGVLLGLMVTGRRFGIMMGGHVTATALTLVVTPAMLMLGERAARGSEHPAAQPA